MPRNYHIERDGVIRRWYGSNPQPGNPRPHRSWATDPVTPADCLGILTPVNLPFRAWGHCMAWKYGLNQYGYGYLTIDGKQEQAHRVVFFQTQGPIPEGKQVNHLCNRPYCVQPAHLYAGTKQDNRDDARIFTDPDLITAPWIMQFPEMRRAEDPLLQRLQERGSSRNIEPWEPVEQPAQLPLEEFTCPGHDFALTMRGGDCRICRICEVSEWDEELAREKGKWLLIAELCPASQTVESIMQKITRSNFLRESHLETRRRAYHRNAQPHWTGDHELRTCDCPYCTQDRVGFRETLEPLLTPEESALLDICDRLEPVITSAIQEASAGMTVAWGMMMGMTGEHLGALWDHMEECPNSVSEQTKTRRTIESDFAYLLHALGRFQDRKEMVLDRKFRDIMLRWGNIRLSEEDEERVFHNVLPAAEAAAEKLVMALEREAERLMKTLLVVSQP